MTNFSRTAHRSLAQFTASSAILILTACGSVPGSAPVVTQGQKQKAPDAQKPIYTPGDKPSQDPTLPPPAKEGGYYLDDGPASGVQLDPNTLSDAVPTAEPLSKYGNKPYQALGKTYVPDTTGSAYQSEGLASWYGKKFHGRRTASGETYDMFKMTAAHRTLPIPSYARVTNLSNGKSTIVRINDRGPFHAARIMDLSYAAAVKLDYIRKGSTQIRIERVFPGEATDTSSSSTPPPSSTYKLQLGVFNVKANAEALRAQLAGLLEADGKRVEVQRVDAVYRVVFGPFPDPDTARAAAPAIAEKTSLQGFVTQ